MRKRIEVIFLVFLFWILFSKGYPVFAQKILNQEERACRYLDKGEVDKAIEILQRVLERSPDNLNANLYLGIAFYLKKDLESASQRFMKIEKGIDKMSGSSYAFGDEAMFTQMGMERKEDVLFLEGRRGLLYFFRGLSLKEKKDLKNAEKRFKKALKLKYDEMATRMQLFDLYIKMKKLKSASKQLDGLKKISGESELLVILDGYLKYRRGSINDALAAFEKIAPTNLEAKKNLARVHYNSGNYQKAMEVWEEIYSLQSDDKEAPLNIGRACFHLGNPDKAQEYFSKAGVKISPDRYSPKKVPLVYETIPKEVKFDLKCK